MMHHSQRIELKTDCTRKGINNVHNRQEPSIASCNDQKRNENESGCCCSVRWSSIADTDDYNDHWSSNYDDNEYGYEKVWSNESCSQWSGNYDDGDFVDDGIDENNPANDGNGKVGDEEALSGRLSVQWSNRTDDNDIEGRLSNDLISNYDTQWSTVCDDYDNAIEYGNDEVLLADSYDGWSRNYDDSFNEYATDYGDGNVKDCDGNLEDIQGTSSDQLEQWSCHYDDENECSNYDGDDYGHDKDHEGRSESACVSERDGNYQWCISFYDDSHNNNNKNDCDNSDENDYENEEISSNELVNQWSCNCADDDQSGSVEELSKCIGNHCSLSECSYNEELANHAGLSNEWSWNYDNDIGNRNDDDGNAVASVQCNFARDNLELNDCHNETIKTAHSCIPTSSCAINLFNGCIRNENSGTIHLKNHPESFSHPSFLVNNDLIGEIIWNMFEKLRINDDYLQVIDGLRLKLESQLRTLYRYNCQLVMFGSLLNGFGIFGCDVDVNLKFVSPQRDDHFDSTAVIMELADVLPQIPEVTEMQSIPTARVPVVKFVYRDVFGCFQFDLSYNNKLAVENTSLLLEYSTVDRRVTPLGIMLKKWSEYCEIKDASYGRLSSYALCIMLIHFLQTTEPPLLPFLQQVKGRDRPKTKRIIDGFDVYFCKANDLMWKTQNVDSLSSLWLNFLDYFGSKFDFENDIIQIRIDKRLRKATRNWANKPMAIEDPFRLKQNLSNHIRAETLDYIKRSFQRGYQQFKRLQEQSEISCDDRSINDIMIKLLQNCRISDGPPNDQKWCSGCNRPGHFVGNCFSSNTFCNNTQKILNAISFLHVK